MGTTGHISATRRSTAIMADGVAGAGRLQQRPRVMRRQSLDQRDLRLGFEEDLQLYLREFEYRHNLRKQLALMFELLCRRFPVRVE
jgi:hypothetical protein